MTKESATCYDVLRFMEDSLGQLCYLYFYACKHHYVEWSNDACGVTKLKMNSISYVSLFVCNRGHSL